MAAVRSSVSSPSGIHPCCQAPVTPQLVIDCVSAQSNGAGSDEARRWLETFAASVRPIEFLFPNINAFHLQTGAWEIVDLLLRENVATEVHFFAAQTMRKKVQRAFHELPTVSYGGLRDSMLGHLTRFARGPAIVATQVRCPALFLRQR